MGVGRIDNEEQLLPPPGPESRSVAGHAACSHHAAQSGQLDQEVLSHRDKEPCTQLTTTKLCALASHRTWLSLFAQLPNTITWASVLNAHPYLHGIESLVCQDIRCCPRSLRPSPNSYKSGNSSRMCMHTESHMHIKNGT